MMQRRLVAVSENRRVRASTSRGAARETLEAVSSRRRVRPTDRNRIKSRRAYMGVIRLTRRRRVSIAPYPRRRLRWTVRVNSDGVSSSRRAVVIPPSRERPRCDERKVLAATERAGHQFA